MTTVSVTWDGYNLVPVQMLLGDLRVNGEPPYRVLGGDFSKLQVWEGTQADGGWVTISPGTLITEEDGEITLIGGSGIGGESATTDDVT